MTFILTVNTRDAIWLVADGRLSTVKGVLTETACKVSRLHAHDGVALIGCAGLGRTAGKTHPSHWIAEVLRGRNLSILDYLATLAKAAANQLPPHLATIPPAFPAALTMIAPVIRGPYPELFEIRNAMSDNRKAGLTQLIRKGEEVRPGHFQTPRIAAIGSGASYLREVSPWRRDLHRLLRGHESARIQSETVARHLARVCCEVSALDTYTGPECIVVWHVRTPNGQFGGGQASFRYGERTDQFGSVPTISQGFHANQYEAAVMQHLGTIFDDYPMLDDNDPTTWPTSEEVEERNRRVTETLAKMPKGPNEKLK